MLFELPVSQRWLRQVMVALTLICRSSYRGVVEFMRDLLGVSTSVGNVHDVQQWAAQQAAALNCEQDLSGIRVGLHDEIFQGSRPVLAGVDAESTYCYLLSAEAHRDGDTWGVHLLDAAQQGLAPDYTIADAGQGLRAGQRAAWGDTPCHGDVFHIQRLCEGLANTLGNLARGARSRREKLDARLNQPRSRARDGGFATQLRQARRSEAQAHQLACDIRTLTQWLSHDILALAGPRLATREALFDFIVEELRKREPLDARRIRRCASRFRTSAMTCSRSLACSIRSLPRSRRAPTYRMSSCALRACCIASRAPRRRTGRAGAGYAPAWAASSTPCSPRCPRPWPTRRAAVRSSRI
ncbi:hypothetical protein [Paraburkholderia sp. MM5482-R1]|uniref:hypothetical protein n=1 Tax=unclassified Paraburkholderia TaxID=2615204 RepID=UPI003D20C933